MNDEIYVDQISNIFVNGNIVRIDFSCLNPAMRDQSGQPVYMHKVRLIMPVDGFTNSLSLQENIFAQLIEKGAVKKPELTPDATGE